MWEEVQQVQLATKFSTGKLFVSRRQLRNNAKSRIDESQVGILQLEYVKKSLNKCNC